MAVIYHRNSNYLFDQAVKHVETSQKSLITTYVVIAVYVICTYFIFSLRVSSDAKIVYQAAISIFLLIYATPLLYEHSRLELRAFKYLFGLKGESLVYKELKKLPNEYIVFCDAVIDYGNIDFVVQKGNIFFNIEVKHNSGRIDFNGARILINGRPFSNRNPIDQLLSNKLKMEQAFKARFGSEPNIVSILVFSNKKSWVHAPYKIGRNLYVLHNRGLRKLIEQHK